MYRKSFFHRLMLTVLGIMVLASGSLGAVYGQQYSTAEYNEYQKAKQDADTLIEYLKTDPNPGLKPYAVGDFKQFLQAHVEKAEHPRAVELAEKFLEAVDSESYEVLYLATWSSFYSQQYEKAAKYGEKVHTLKPDAPHIVPILARSYQKTSNIEKAIPYAVETCAGLEPKDCYDLLPMITRQYFDKKSWDEAGKYADLTIKAFDAVEAPAGIAQAEWDSFASEEKSVCYAILGKVAFEKKRWSTTEKHYGDSRKLKPANKARAAEGYYHVGMSRWNRELIDSAMEAFARGSKLAGTPHADPCRQQLEKLYRATHNGSLAGLEEFVGRF